MSKIGRKPIAFSSAKIDINGLNISIKGAKESFSHILPEGFKALLDGQTLKLELQEKNRENNILWGLHRALLANKIQGVEAGFEQTLNIVGLGFKAILAGSKLSFTLGYTHKIEYDLPKEVTVVLDKTGQQLVFKSADRFILGNVCDAIRSFRPPEPYKGTGIIRKNEVIIRKAGKTKSA